MTNHASLHGGKRQFYQLDAIKMGQTRFRCVSPYSPGESCAVEWDLTVGGGWLIVMLTYSGDITDNEVVFLPMFKPPASTPTTVARASHWGHRGPT